MAAMRRPLLRFAAFASGGVIVAIAACTLLGMDRLIMAAAAVLMAPAAWIAGLRRWSEIVAAIPLSAVLYTTILVIPLHLLLGGTYNRIAARQIGELTATMALWSMLPVLAGCILTRYRPFHGGSS
jgi:hypothetical protein